jgi:hypothetical protein
MTDAILQKTIRWVLKAADPTAPSMPREFVVYASSGMAAETAFGLAFPTFKVLGTTPAGYVDHKGQLHLKPDTAAELVVDHGAAPRSKRKANGG